MVHFGTWFFYLNHRYRKLNLFSSLSNCRSTWDVKSGRFKMLKPTAFSFWNIPVSKWLLTGNSSYSLFHHDSISVVEVLTALRSNGRSGDESLDEVTGVRIRNDEIAMLKEELNQTDAKLLVVVFKYCWVFGCIAKAGFQNCRRWCRKIRF